MRMKTIFKIWKEKLFGDEVDVKMRFQNIALLSIISLALVDATTGSIGRWASPTFWPVLFADVVIVLLFGCALCIFRHMKGVLTILCALMVTFVFPILFFLCGGIEGSGEMWIIIGIFISFMMLSGKTLYAMIGFTCLIDTAVYILSYRHPEWLFHLETKSAIMTDASYTMIILSIVMGLFLKLSMSLYESERSIANKRAEELERISRARSAFFANMSHEIRTPINTIIGLNEMILREQNLSEEVAENAANIYNASKLLLTVINDILDVSKIESGKMEIVPVQYETGAMFSDLVNLLWIRIYDKNLEFKLDIDKNIPSMLYGDEIRLKQAVANLLTNAVKYTEKGSITLSVKSEQIGGNMARLRISVEDTGMGIKKENLKDLFSTFQRVNQEKNRSIEGTGLGLPISKQLIELMGGQIVVDSVYKMGSVFTIIVDQQIVNAQPIGSVDFTTKRRRNIVRYQQRFEAPAANVLIVDDNEMNLLVAKKLLRETKVQTDTASSGRECLQKTKDKAYHVIFMDHIMPDMDGEETLGEIRRQENGRCKETPIIALTANAMSGAEQIYRDKGFEGYLAKPINGALIEATLFKFLPESLIEYSAGIDEAENVDDAVKVFSGGRKKKIRVVTDCTCGLPRELLERFEIKTMYSYVQTNEGRFCDIREISSDSLMRYLKKEGNTASSEPASVEEYENFFADALHEAETVIHISASSGISDGYNRAVEAADSFDNVTVFDSKHLSGGLGIMVLHAAKMAQSGQSAEEICRELAVLREKVSSSFILDKPESLYQNGKMQKQVQTLFHALQLHPILHMSKGSIRSWRFASGKKEQAYKKYIRMLLAHKNKIDKRILFMIHANCSTEELNGIQAEISKIIPFEQVQVQKASATVSANFGAGMFGLMFLKK